MDKTATLVKNIEDWRGDARLYELSHPVNYGELGKDKEMTTKFVIVSAVFVPFSGPETYIFPSSSEGVAINHLNLDGSFQGGLDHERALNGAGYEIIDTEGT